MNSCIREAKWVIVWSLFMMFFDRLELLSAFRAELEVTLMMGEISTKVFSIFLCSFYSVEMGFTQHQGHT